MPANKDFKRLVRARMEKTGEAYTTARSHLLTSKQQPPAVISATADYSSLAGMRDAVMKERTGRDWNSWVEALDSAGAHRWPHREIARYVHERFDIPGWWTQAVTVGYERIKGLRAIGQRRDGGFEANKSKTIAAPLARVYRAWSDRRTRGRWLPGVALQVRTSVRNKSMRLTWPDQTSVHVYFIEKGRSKSQVAVQHEKLPDRAAVTRMKSYWTERLTELASLLTRSGG